MTQTHPPQFGATLRALLINAGIVTRMGNPDWTGLVRQMQGVNYESLRKAVVGERPPSGKIMIAAAEALGVEPTIFIEYRLLEARRSLDPDYVGWRAATKALERYDRIDRSGSEEALA
jgi:transcriptional regulator with XRE-family HTH domain